MKKFAFAILALAMFSGVANACPVQGLVAAPFMQQPLVVNPFAQQVMVAPQFVQPQFLVQQPQFLVQPQAVIVNPVLRQRVIQRQVIRQPRVFQRTVIRSF
jgi:hypothetical protein